MSLYSENECNVDRPLGAYPHMTHQQVHCNDCLRTLFIVICAKYIMHYGKIVLVQLLVSPNLRNCWKIFHYLQQGCPQRGLRTSLLLLAQVSFKCLSAACYRVFISELYQLNHLIHCPGNGPNNVFYIEARIGTSFQNTLSKAVWKKKGIIAGKTRKMT